MSFLPNLILYLFTSCVIMDNTVIQEKREAPGNTKVSIVKVGIIVKVN